jgi:hypothetical protein
MTRSVSRSRRLRLAVTAAVLAAVAACSGELSSPTEPLRLLATSLPAAFAGEQYDVPLRPTGGLRPYGFDVVDGELPDGLTISGGRLVGTPLATGSFSFTVELFDANLNRTVQRYTLTVRPLPSPGLRVDAPTTEVRRPVPLRLTVETARAWRGAKVELAWDAEAFELDAGSVAPARRSITAFWEAEPGRLRVDLAVLGGAIDGEAELLRFTLIPVAPSLLDLALSGESRYAGGHHYAERREGARAPAPDPAPPPGDDDDEDETTAGPADEDGQEDGQEDEP